jgi:hypothetical protein
MTEFKKDPTDPYRKVAGFVWHVQVMRTNMSDSTFGPCFPVTAYWNPNDTHWDMNLGTVSLTADRDWSVKLYHLDKSKRFELLDFKGIYRYLREQVLGLPIYECFEQYPYERERLLATFHPGLGVYTMAAIEANTD